MSQNLYRVLGVSENASKDAIKNAYRRLVKELHPDRNSSAAAPQQFQRVREAYEVLSDASKRLQYDQKIRGHGFSGDSSSFSSSSRAQAANMGSATSHGQPNMSYWEAYDRARRMRVDWEARRRADAEWAKAHPEYYRAFNEEKFRQSVTMTFLRAWPLLAPFCIIALIWSMQKTPGDHDRRRSLVYDEQGRAFAVDTYGHFHRLQQLDKL